eukprot:CAMPEP_0174365322 /NCGR_PEP_ID=MMETSP0811_2-20130205/76801_1 /TAXON_ID=73025 ORGANISM="Eutreptiella gymnastica-like, Strain CCMP1594" /NCGR_SAMPLE_ID=MMETSP0811_2 /ASSEMBLY_ACC=CAM_ASM_000667 /LENGTH=173 /DNA_ID=CAMNT_0015505875 /DNA_START=38 /DNA_END=556 /DNA_ORIENTATION=+
MTADTSIHPSAAMGWTVSSGATEESVSSATQRSWTVSMETIATKLRAFVRIGIQVTVTITAIARARAAPRCIKSCVVTGRHASTPIVTSATQRGCSASTRTSAVYRKGNAHFGIQVVPPCISKRQPLPNGVYGDWHSPDHLKQMCLRRCRVHSQQPRVIVCHNRTPALPRASS